MVAKAKSPKIKETDLFPPVRDYLEKNGYTVRSEVRNCDIVAVKDSDVIVVELKTGMNVSLLIQATDRQRITDSVYVAIPDPPGRKGAHWRGIKRVFGFIGRLFSNREPEPVSASPVQVSSPGPITGSPHRALVSPKKHGDSESG